MDGEFLTGFRINNGMLVAQFMPKQIKSHNKNTNPCDKYEEGSDWNCGELDESIVTSPTPYVSITTIYETGGDTERTGDFDQAYYDYCQGGCGASNATTPTEEEDKIDDSQLKDCHSKIIDTLKTINTGILGKMIQKLAGSNPTDYNWTIDYNMPAGSDPAATAVTNPAAMNSTSVTHINLNRVQNSTDLSMARTFAHEAVHAFLVYQFRYDRNASELNYVQLVDKYASQHNNNLNDAHHVLYLEENLITPIANALQEVGTKLGYNLPPSFYLDLAYGGLYNSNATNTIFNSLVPNQADRDRIKARISAEADNTTKNGVSPEGEKAC